MTLLSFLLSPNIVRALMYVGIIVGSAIVFTSSATMVGTSFTNYVAETVGNHPVAPLPRSDVPLPSVATPDPVPAQAQGIAEPPAPESSITTLASAAPGETSVAVAAPAESSITSIAAPDFGPGQMRVTSDVTIRAVPGKNGSALGTIGAGEIVTAEANDNGWIQISQNGAILGWVYQRFLAPAQ